MANRRKKKGNYMTVVTQHVIKPYRSAMLNETELRGAVRCMLVFGLAVCWFESAPADNVKVAIKIIFATR
jgi:hypothetical protein